MEFVFFLFFLFLFFFLGHEFGAGLALERCEMPFPKGEKADQTVGKVAVLGPFGDSLVVWWGEAQRGEVCQGLSLFGERFQLLLAFLAALRLCQGPIEPMAMAIHPDVKRDQKNLA